jgi:hypothetical protein
MSEEQSVAAFQGLPTDRRQEAIALMGRMALRQIRSAIAIGGSDDDLRIGHDPARPEPAGEDLRATSRSSMFANPRFSRLSAIRNRHGCNMPWLTALSRSAGLARRLSRSTMIWVARAPRSRGGSAFSGWSPKSDWVVWGWFSGWRCRLARSCRDWHQLLEICALFDTLIADADGVYDPSSFNDRLLLGLKGTMSEAELHIIKARMLEGRRAKARRGELVKPLPMGYARRPSGEVIFDPDEQVQAVIRLVFDLFERLLTVGAVLDYLVVHNIQMPVRRRDGPTRGDLEWRRPNRATLHNLFGNPIYAGVYTWGTRPIERRCQRPGLPGTGRRSLGPEDVEVFLPDRLPAYISRDQFERIQAQIRSNRTSKKGPVRAGSALLSGLVVCGECGLRMSVSYNNNGQTARYICQGMYTSYGDPFCQSLQAASVDAQVTRLVLQALEPAAIEISLAVASDLEVERITLDRQWQQRLERAQFTVD